MAVSRPSEHEPDISASTFLTESCVQVEHVAPTRPTQAKPSSQFSLFKASNQTSSHIICPAKKTKYPTEQKATHFYKSHSTSRMAEIEAFAAQCMSFFMPGKVPSVHGIINEDDNYQYMGVTSRILPEFIPYRKKPLEERNLQPPVNSAAEKEYNDMLLKQVALVDAVKKLKVFYEQKYTRRTESNNPVNTAQPSTSSWWNIASTLVSSATQVIGDVAQSTKGFANYYKPGTSAALIPQLQAWLDNRNQFTIDGLNQLKLSLQERRTQISKLAADHPGLDVERPLILEIESNLELKETHAKRFSHATTRHLEQIHSQITRLAWSPNRITGNAAGNLLSRIKVLAQSSPSKQSAAEIMACSLIPEGLARITSDELKNADELLNLLKNVKILGNHGRSLNTAIRNAIQASPFINQKRPLPTLRIKLNEVDKKVVPAYELTPIHNAMTLVDLISHLKNTGIASAEQCDKINESLTKNNLILSTLVFAQVCPCIVQTHIETYLPHEAPTVFPVQDIDNYAIKKGLAEGLVASYLFKEGDNHACNMDIYGNRVDNDMTLWDVGYSYKLTANTYTLLPNEIYDVTVRTPDEKSFDITPRDILKFPDVETPGLYYWPTKDAGLRAQVKFVFKNQSVNNEFTKKDNELFKRLASDPDFIFHKYKAFLKFTLIHYSVYENLAYANIRSDVDRGRLLQQMKISLSKRIDELKNVLANMPEYSAFLKTDGQYALQLIEQEFLAQKAALEAKRCKMKDSKEITHVVANIHSLELSLLSLADLKATITPTFTPSNSGVFSSSGYDDVPRSFSPSPQASM